MGEKDKRTESGFHVASPQIGNDNHSRSVYSDVSQVVASECVAHTHACVCVMLQRGVGGMGVDKTFTSDGPGYFSIVIGYEGFMV